MFALKITERTYSIILFNLYYFSLKVFLLLNSFRVLIWMHTLAHIVERKSNLIIFDKFWYFRKNLTKILKRNLKKLFQLKVLQMFELITKWLLDSCSSQKKRELKSLYKLEIRNLQNIYWCCKCIV